MPSQYEKHLAEAQRHVVEGEQRVTRQIVLIERLAVAGHDTTDAKALLKTLEDALALMRKHLQMILDERAGERL